MLLHAEDLETAQRRLTRPALFSRTENNALPDKKTLYQKKYCCNHCNENDRRNGHMLCREHIKFKSLFKLFVIYLIISCRASAFARVVVVLFYFIFGWFFCHFSSP